MKQETKHELGQVRDAIDDALSVQGENTDTDKLETAERLISGALALIEEVVEKRNDLNLGAYVAHYLRKLRDDVAERAERMSDREEEELEAYERGEVE